MFFKIILGAVTLFFVFSFSYAADLTGGVDTLSGIINKITEKLVSALGQLFLASGVVAFLFGVVQYIWGKRQGDASKTKVGSDFMLWGLIGLFVMFSVYGIVKFAQRTVFGDDYKNVNTIEIPEFNLIKGKGQTGTPVDPNKVPFGGAGAGEGNQGTSVSSPVSSQGVSNQSSIPSLQNQGQGVAVTYYCSDGTAYYDISDKKLCASSVPTEARPSSIGSEETESKKVVFNCYDQKTSLACNFAQCVWGEKEQSCLPKQVGSTGSVGGPAGMCSSDPIRSPNDVSYEDVTQDECNAKCSSTCYSFCSGQKGCGMWGCWACPQ